MKPLVIAHNGGLEGGAAGSVESFADTLESGCDAVEFDVRRRRDGVLVVQHDPLADGDDPPRLDDVLTLFGRRLLCNLEVKEAGFVEEVVATAKRHLPPELLLVTSAVDAVVAAARVADPDLLTGLVVGRKRDPPPARDELAARIEATGAGLLVAHYERAPLDVAAGLGVPVYTWTVNDEAALRALLADERCDGVITDYPRRAVALRQLR